jgi:hypothetical protein
LLRSCILDYGPVGELTQGLLSARREMFAAPERGIVCRLFQ